MGQAAAEGKRAGNGVQVEVSGRRVTWRRQARGRRHTRAHKHVAWTQRRRRFQSNFIPNVELTVLYSIVNCPKFRYSQCECTCKFYSQGREPVEAAAGDGRGRVRAGIKGLNTAADASEYFRSRSDLEFMFNFKMMLKY
jgi:hypothetical protein